MVKIILIFIFSIFSYALLGQLQTSGGISPGQLVQDVLLGDGVEVFNINYTGSNQAIGTFDATNTSVGIDEGILITTGTINKGPEGPHGPNNRKDAGLDNGAAGYGPLSNLVNGKTFNAAVLEFDFIPYSDTVRFKYVFASEEYPEYVNTDFNDVFAFFISGPGIPGGTRNMAIIPGTSQAVAINNVNHLSNTGYYQNNGDGVTAPYNSNPYYVQYDGFTVPLEAVSKVQCGETYHLIIAIADVGDAVWDSGIFLEKNSLNSEQPVKVDYTLSSDPYGDGKTMAQNCTSATVTVTRSGNKINEALSIPINLFGSAVEGLDYSSIPNSIDFLPGQTSFSFTVDALNNMSLAGIADLIIQFEIEDACGNEAFQTVELFIRPVDPVEITLDDQSLICPGEPIELIPVATGGGGDYHYQWSTGETTPTIFVNPLETTSYTVSVTDECLNETATVTAVVTIPEYDPLVVNVSDDIVEQCPYMPNTLFATPIGGAGSYEYVWYDETGRALGYLDSLEVKARQTTTYTVVVEDVCGEVDTAEVTITVLSPPLVLDITPAQQICPGDSVQLTVTGTGGWGDYYYYWPHSEETTASVWVNPSEDTEYIVIVKDDCQTFQVQAKTNVKVVQPTADFNIISSPLYIGLPITFQNTSQGANDYYWTFGDGMNSNLIHPNNVYTEPGDYDVTLVATDLNGCMDSISKPIRILEEFYIYAPNSFTPDGDRNNNTFTVSTIGVEEFHILIYNRWGELVFEAHDKDFEWDGTYGPILARDGTYVWKINYRSVHDEETQTMVGHVNLIR